MVLINMSFQYSLWKCLVQRLGQLSPVLYPVIRKYRFLSWYIAMNACNGIEMSVCQEVLAPSMVGASTMFVVRIIMRYWKTGVVSQVAWPCYISIDSVVAIFWLSGAHQDSHQLMSSSGWKSLLDHVISSSGEWFLYTCLQQMIKNCCWYFLGRVCDFSLHIAYFHS